MPTILNNSNGKHNIIKQNIFNVKLLKIKFIKQNIKQSQTIFINKEE